MLWCDNSVFATVYAWLTRCARSSHLITLCHGLNIEYICIIIWSKFAVYKLEQSWSFHNFTILDVDPIKRMRSLKKGLL